MQRKITQIAATAAADYPPTLYALCDDSSVWVGSSNKFSDEFHWHRLPDVPQDAGEQDFAKPRTGVLTRSSG